MVLNRALYGEIVLPCGYVLAVDAKDQLEAIEYSERNRQFKADLQEALGGEELAEFKTCSASFRRFIVQAGTPSDRQQAVRNSQ